jgi:hypothetical protein
MDHIPLKFLKKGSGLYDLIFKNLIPTSMKTYYQNYTYKIKFVMSMP